MLIPANLEQILVTELMYKLNNAGLHGSPCGTPTDALKGVVRCPFTSTLITILQSVCVMLLGLPTLGSGNNKPIHNSSEGMCWVVIAKLIASLMKFKDVLFNVLGRGTEILSKPGMVFLSDLIVCCRDLVVINSKFQFLTLGFTVIEGGVLVIGCEVLNILWKWVDMV